VNGPRTPYLCEARLTPPSAEESGGQVGGIQASHRPIPGIKSPEVIGQIAAALPEVLEDDTQLLFIENVGNMVCPTAFDLGEHFKVALLSTPEGEDKPEKYPVLFATAKLALLTKMDLAEPLDWDLKACQRSIQSVHPGMVTLKLSAKTGDGMPVWLDYLESLVQ